MSAKVFFVFLLSFISFIPLAFGQGENLQESDQQISEFSLSSFGDKGKKAWDISGTSADIFSNTVKLKDVVGNLYGDKEDIRLTADKGDFDRQDGKIHLEENVVITTSTGTKMTTDSLDWDRKNQLVATDDVVNIERGNMVTTASGARGKPDLKKVNLNKDVTVNINPDTAAGGNDKEAGLKDKIVITCTGPLEIDYGKNIATFNDNVKVDKEDLLIESDKMDVYFGQSKGSADKEDAGSQMDLMSMGSKIDRIVARGNVKITRGENTSYSDEATYNALNKTVTLSGSPKLVIYSAEEMNASFGD